MAEQTNSRSSDLVLGLALSVLAPMLGGILAIGANAVEWAVSRRQLVPASAVLIMGLFVGSVLAARTVKRWPSGRVHSPAWLVLSGIAACGGAYVAVVALAPWPDVLSDEVIRAGQVRFYYEMVKTGIPFVVAVVAAFGLLRYGPGRVAA